MTIVIMYITIGIITKTLFKNVLLQKTKVKTKKSHRKFTLMSTGIRKTLLLRDWLARKNSVGTFIKRNCNGIPINKLYTITLQWLRSEFIIKVERCLKTVK